MFLIIKCINYTAGKLINNQFVSTMNTFGISLFREPEQFIALSLGMRLDAPKFVTFVQKLLNRTKSPPIAITYTCHFLKDKSEEELSLDVIRFVSQLADLSPGVSMSSSLYNILAESSFLTELRHSLTHKTMVKGTILQLSKEMILHELQQKYWNVTITKLKDTYALSEKKVRQYYKIIYGTIYLQDLAWIKNNFKLEYFHDCSNYQYKEHIKQVIQSFKNCCLGNQEFYRYYQTVTEQKQIIHIVLLLQEYLSSQFNHENFDNYVIKFIAQLNPTFHTNQHIIREYRKAYFMRYLKRNHKLYDSLPNNTKQSISQYWQKKEQKIGSLYVPIS